MQSIQGKRKRIARDRMVLKPSYPATLKAIPVGESKMFRGTARNIQPIRNAASRLNRAGTGLWAVEVIGDDNVKVTRIA